MGTLPAETFSGESRECAYICGVLLCSGTKTLYSLYVLLPFILGVLEQLLTLLPKSFTAEIQLAFLVFGLMRQDLNPN